MELPSGMIKAFDLNMGSSCLWSESIGDDDQYCDSKEKHGFCEAAYKQGKCVLRSTPPKTLPLLSWDQNQQPIGEDDQTDDLDESSSTSNKSLSLSLSHNTEKQSEYGSSNFFHVHFYGLRVMYVPYQTS